MDWNSLKDSVTNLTLYDVKASVRKVQNAVMNYTEMEAKVREATNNEPWGASSTLMQEIADATFNYQSLNEIMPMIYRRFTEKTAEEWRQIYKALQLLEYLIKHGSERVIDDARSHLTLLKMLRQFHYIDQNGKDQGLNVRNRAKELAELLGDVDRIRAERKKARANKAKYTGTGSSVGGGGGLSTGRYGGFGSGSAGYSGGQDSPSYGGYSGGVYGDGGGFGGQSDEWRGTSSGGGGGGSGSRGGDKFEEYDEYEEGESRPSASASSSRTGVQRTTGGGTSTVKRAEVPAHVAKAKNKAPEADLFTLDDHTGTATSTFAAPAAPLQPPTGGSSLTTAAPTASNTHDDDEFDDFQSAAPVAGGAQPVAPTMVTSTASNARFVSPQPVSAPNQANLGSMVGLSSISPPPAPNHTASSTPAPNYSAFSTPMSAAAITPSASGPLKPTAYQASQPNYFGSVPAFGSTQQQQSQNPSRQSSGLGSTASMSSAGAASAAKPAGGDAFGSLWSAASGGVKKSETPGTGPSMGQLAREKSAAGMFGAASASNGGKGPARNSNAGFDLF